MKYLIVGSGLFGSVCAHELAKSGHQVKVIEKRNHIAGNIYTKEIEGINVHQYGAHIFHTSNRDIWNYIQKFAEFNRYTNSPIANYKGEIYNLPFNMNTFNKLWGVSTPKEAKNIIDKQKSILSDKEPKNLEEQAISLVGIDIYEKLIKEYTEKQWGRPCSELPSFIIKRLPVRFTYDNNYFNDKYQGIPIGGYTQIIEKMLSHDRISIELNTDFFENRKKFEKIYDRIIYTGTIDQFYDYKFGNLEYRSLNFETEILDQENYQGNAVVNYTDAEHEYTRIIEHKHFEFGQQPKTIITKEYSLDWKFGNEPYYPVNDKKNNEIYLKYKELSSDEDKYIFGGRLGTYKYLDMHMIIQSALKVVSKELKTI